MKKISGRVLSSKPVSLSRAAKIINRFAAVENGASPAVSLYLQRTAEAFNRLVKFHNKRPKISGAENSADREGGQKLQTDSSLEGKEAKDSKRKLESDRETGKKVAEANPRGDEVKDLNSEEKEKRKKKKKKSDGDDAKEMRNNKKKRLEVLES